MHAGSQADRGPGHICMQALKQVATYACRPPRRQGPRGGVHSIFCSGGAYTMDPSRMTRPQCVTFALNPQPPSLGVFVAQVLYGSCCEVHAVGPHINANHLTRLAHLANQAKGGKGLGHTPSQQQNAPHPTQTLRSTLYHTVTKPACRWGGGEGQQG